VDLEVEVRRPALGVAGVADQADDVARLHQRAVGEALGEGDFGGLSLEETADALHLSLATIKRELRLARAWLAAELMRDSA
jgi:hypothetical protein